ncbi:hypothetical protein [Frigoriglobus tundricola]|uniref:Uncharacterized protein n=1 Tax=Frigoriglobus tundricola TaxID=2774151 RepID=A0A6M5YMN6_9BACT|nr:hypothetical protein [Frigoriglobus tundricola]QJW95389.1 hypothetical protein FTUN_2938 [Frigoriglobus tundricola]
MSEMTNQPWPYLATVLVTALLLGRRLKLWGFGFGVEVHPAGKTEAEGRTAPKAQTKKRPKQKKKRRGK